MIKVESLEKEIKGLSRAELEEFRNWFKEYDSEEWDKQIEEDAKTGKLDALVEKALKEHNRTFQSDNLVTLNKFD